MLTRNDSIILGQQVDVNKALDLLKMFQEAGRRRLMSGPFWMNLLRRLKALLPWRLSWSNLPETTKPATYRSSPTG